MHIAQSEQLVQDTFREFRPELMRQYGKIAYDTKADHTQVTELDLRIEQELGKRMHAQFPMLGYGGEETGYALQTDKPYWLVDPIDSTNSFIRGLPNCTNMAAYIDEEGQAQRAIIYDFIEDHMYTAVRGEGAYRDGERLHVHARPLDQSVVYAGGHIRMHADHVRRMYEAGGAMYRPIGASGKTYILLAEGKIDGYYLLNAKPSPHDNAPGMLLAREAGAVVMTKDDEPWTIESGNFVVGTPEVAVFLGDFFNA